MIPGVEGMGKKKEKELAYEVKGPTVRTRRASNREPTYCSARMRLEPVPLCPFEEGGRLHLGSTAKRAPRRGVECLIGR